jgi:hypothetical protein
MIYTAPKIMLFKRAYREFLGPCEIASSRQASAIWGPKKTSYGPWKLMYIYKTIYRPLIDMALCAMLLMQENPLLGQVGGGWALEISTFVALAISQGPKKC